MNSTANMNMYDRYNDPQGCRQTLIAFVIAVLLIILAIALHGCKCPCDAVVTNTSDSTNVQVRGRDTVIVTKADSASLLALLKCDSAYNVVLFDLVCMQGERIDANSHAQHTSDGGMILTFDCKEDSLENIIHMQDSIIKSFHAETVVKYVEVEKSPFLYNSGIALWVLISLAVIAAIIGIVIKFAL